MLTKSSKRSKCAIKQKLSDSIYLVSDLSGNNNNVMIILNGANLPTGVSIYCNCATSCDEHGDIRLFVYGLRESDNNDVSSHELYAYKVENLKKNIVIHCVSNNGEKYTITVNALSEFYRKNRSYFDYISAHIMEHGLYKIISKIGNSTSSRQNAKCCT